MTLREHIKYLIELLPEDANEVATRILLLLEDEGLGLVGNGWLDDDPELLDRLEE